MSEAQHWHSLISPRLHSMVEKGIERGVGYEAIIMATILSSRHSILGKNGGYHDLAKDIGYDPDLHFSELIFQVEIFKYWLAQGGLCTFRRDVLNCQTLGWIKDRVDRLTAILDVKPESNPDPEPDALLEVICLGLPSIFYPRSPQSDYFVVAVEQEGQYHPGTLLYTLERHALGFTEMVSGHLVIGLRKQFEHRDQLYQLVQFATRIHAMDLRRFNSRVTIYAGSNLYYDPHLDCVMEVSQVHIDHKQVQTYLVPIHGHQLQDALKAKDVLENQVQGYQRSIRRIVDQYPDLVVSGLKQQISSKDYLRRLETEQLESLQDSLRQIYLDLLEQAKQNNPVFEQVITLERDGELTSDLASALKQMMMGGRHQ